MLDAALEATETDDGVTLALRIENGGSEPVTLRFRTGQRVEFTAYPADGGADADGSDDGGRPDGDADDPVWRYGAGRMFTQALGSETLAPAESVTHEATWRSPPAGTYRIVGEAAATDRDPRADAVVTVEG
ncbi:BsuPI-related putative proteinase inhibitor [Halorubrum tebenquichense]|uniref:Intracellular proteinase inhibitor BsuPI domain-containing protein n=1 Tax=Halorubrum tebenquichense DSM 14210 TaxID=1227485 RepID=M0DW21_9EURY|nr:BsuPI-related putative proteinase inhibitor [Halorubrum tebenquichense]ELZ39686.1 hypothetical protein C472_03688 [Halorubrum tebenquichense DSM 14210]